MGHYDDCYEYDRKHGTLHDRYSNKTSVDNPTSPSTFLTYTSPMGPFTELDITKFRFHIEDGRAKIVLDVDKVPTYSFTLGRKQTSELLQQLYNKQHE